MSRSKASINSQQNDVKLSASDVVTFEVGSSALGNSISGKRPSLFPQASSANDESSRIGVAVVNLEDQMILVVGLSLRLEGICKRSTEASACLSTTSCLVFVGVCRTQL